MENTRERRSRNAEEEDVAARGGHGDKRRRSPPPLPLVFLDGLASVPCSSATQGCAEETGGGEREEARFGGGRPKPWRTPPFPGMEPDGDGCRNAFRMRALPAAGNDRVRQVDPWPAKLDQSIKPMYLLGGR